MSTRWCPVHGIRHGIRPAISAIRSCMHMCVRCNTKISYASIGRTFPCWRCSVRCEGCVGGPAKTWKADLYCAFPMLHAGAAVCCLSKASFTVSTLFGLLFLFPEPFLYNSAASSSAVPAEKAFTQLSLYSFAQHTSFPKVRYVHS